MNTLPRCRLARCEVCSRQVLHVRGPGGKMLTLDCAAKVFHVQREPDTGYCAVPADDVFVEHRFACGTRSRGSAA